VDRIGHRPLIHFSAFICFPGVLVWTVATYWQWIIPGMVLYAVSFAVPCAGSTAAH
jgi:hypothetical protein